MLDVLKSSFDVIEKEYVRLEGMFTAIRPKRSLVIEYMNSEIYTFLYL